MKYDLSSKPTKGATRVLNALTSTLFSLLFSKPFEEITVNEICDESGYPRATFYNYFDDKYDLLGYFWHCVAKEIKLDEYTKIPPEKLLDTFHDRMYDLCEKYEYEIKRLFKNNAWDGYFFASFKIYLSAQLKTIFNHYPLREGCPVPKELMVEHYGNTLFTIFEWRFGKESAWSRDETRRLVNYLLADL